MFNPVKMFNPVMFNPVLFNPLSNLTDRHSPPGREETAGITLAISFLASMVSSRLDRKGREWPLIGLVFAAGGEMTLSEV
jgi:hypothetical protein